MVVLGHGVTDVILNEIYVVEDVNKYICDLRLVFMVARAMNRA